MKKYIFITFEDGNLVSRQFMLKRSAGTDFRTISEEVFRNWSEKKCKNCTDHVQKDENVRHSNERYFDTLRVVLE